MRVGILTFHRAHNYGAVLQCFALQQYLISRGDDAYVIDYNNKDLWSFYHWRDKGYEKYVTSNLFKFPYRLLQYLHAKKKHIIRYYKFVYFQKRYLRLAPVDSIQKSPYDLILIGSDQVWNTTITHGFDMYYWGQFDHPSSTKVATYAASLRELWKVNDYGKVYNYLSKLDGISVREKSTQYFLNNTFPNLEVSYVPDPVLLIPVNHWKKMAKKPPIKSSYYFFYQAAKSKKVLFTAKEIANQRRANLISLSADVKAINSDECHTASPQEFLGWILYADMVITSSFHALIFSILFNKDFYAINLNMGHDDRIRNIVTMFDLEDRLIDDETQCKRLIQKDNKDLVKQLLDNANDYLSKFLNK